MRSLCYNLRFTCYRWSILRRIILSPISLFAIAGYAAAHAIADAALRADVDPDLCERIYSIADTALSLAQRTSLSAPLV